MSSVPRLHEDAKRKIASRRFQGYCSELEMTSVSSVSKLSGLVRHFLLRKIGHRASEARNIINSQLLPVLRAMAEIITFIFVFGENKSSVILDVRSATPNGDILLASAIYPVLPKEACLLDLVRQQGRIRQPQHSRKARKQNRCRGFAILSGMSDRASNLFVCLSPSLPIFERIYLTCHGID